MEENSRHPQAGQVHVDDQSAAKMREQQQRMKMLNEASPSKASSSGARQRKKKSVKNTDNVGLPERDDSDLDDAFQTGSDKSQIESERSSTPKKKENRKSAYHTEVETLPSRKKGKSCTRESKQLVRTSSSSGQKNSNSLLASAGRKKSSSPRVPSLGQRGKTFFRMRSRAGKNLKRRKSSVTASRKQVEVVQVDNDSEWESMPDTEMENSRSSFDANQFERPLVISIDGGEEVIDERRIPMKKQLEKTIQEGRASNNLTVANVKHILKSLITHDLVKEMLKTTLRASNNEEVPAGSLVYEPKLTRSRMKEVLEKGQDPKLWPVSPAKLGKSATRGPSFLDVEFNDEDDDEEYEPSKDAEAAESDDESLTSSQVSELGSPFTFGSPPISRRPSTPSTPLLLISSRPTTPLSAPVIPSTSTESLVQANIGSPMGPPLKLPPCSAKQRLTFLSPQKTPEEEAAEWIALRTRSKLPLTTTSLYDIEDAFIAPDITPDMYDMIGDSDWQDFLKSLQRPGDEDADPHSDVMEGDDDPEFNYIAEAETEEMEAEEDMFHGPFRVSRKELNSLMEELEDLFDEDDCSLIGLRTNLATAQEIGTRFNSNQASEDESPSPLKRKSRGKHMEESENENDKEDDGGVAMEGEAESGAGKEKGKGKKKKKRKDKETEETQPVQTVTLGAMVTAEQVKHIQEHMRMHVQLTTQMYLLASGSTDYQHYADTSKNLLKELDVFRRTSRSGTHSSFNACNLDEALDIVNKEVDWASHRQAANSTSRGDSSSAKLLRCLGHDNRPLLQVQKEIIWRSPVFTYPSLLPHISLHSSDNIQRFCRRVHFAEAEKRLLVVAVDGLKTYKGNSMYKKIADYLMPCKTSQQLYDHFNHRHQKDDSVFGKYKKNGEVPKNCVVHESFSVDFMKAPCKQPLDSLPAWCKTYHQKLKSEKQQREDEIKEKNQQKARKRRWNASRRKSYQKQKSLKHRLRALGETVDTSSDGSSEDTDSESDSAADSASEELPPKKKRRLEEEPVKSLQSMPATSQPAAVITPKGIFVAAHLGDVSKINSLFTGGAAALMNLASTSTATVVDISHQQPVMGSHATSFQQQQVMGSQTTSFQQQPSMGSQITSVQQQPLMMGYQPTNFQQQQVMGYQPTSFQQQPLMMGYQPTNFQEQQAMGSQTTNFQQQQVMGSQTTNFQQQQVMGSQTTNFQQQQVMGYQPTNFQQQPLMGSQTPIMQQLQGYQFSIPPHQQLGPEISNMNQIPLNQQDAQTSQLSPSSIVERMAQFVHQNLPDHDASAVDSQHDASVVEHDTSGVDSEQGHAVSSECVNSIMISQQGSGVGLTERDTSLVRSEQVDRNENVEEIISAPECSPKLQTVCSSSNSLLVPSSCGEQQQSAGGGDSLRPQYASGSREPCEQCEPDSPSEELEKRSKENGEGECGGERERDDNHRQNNDSQNSSRPVCNIPSSSSSHHIQQQSSLPDGHSANMLGNCSDPDVNKLNHNRQESIQNMDGQSSHNDCVSISVNRKQGSPVSQQLPESSRMVACEKSDRTPTSARKRNEVVVQEAHSNDKNGSEGVFPSTSDGRLGMNYNSLRQLDVPSTTSTYHKYNFKGFFKTLGRKGVNKSPAKKVTSPPKRLTSPLKRLRSPLNGVRISPYKNPSPCGRPFQTSPSSSQQEADHSERNAMKIAASAFMPITSAARIINTASGVNITINMLYSSEYNQQQPSKEDAAEGPSSTTPDEDAGGPSQAQVTAEEGGGNPEGESAATRQPGSVGQGEGSGHSQPNVQARGRVSNQPPHVHTHSSNQPPHVHTHSSNQPPHVHTHSSNSPLLDDAVSTTSDIGEGLGASGSVAVYADPVPPCDESSRHAAGFRPGLLAGVVETIHVAEQGQRPDDQPNQTTAVPGASGISLAAGHMSGDAGVEREQELTQATAAGDALSSAGISAPAVPAATGMIRKLSATNPSQMQAENEQSPPPSIQAAEEREVGEMESEDDGNQFEDDGNQFEEDGNPEPAVLSYLGLAKASRKLFASRQSTSTSAASGSGVPSSAAVAGLSVLGKSRIQTRQSALKGTLPSPAEPVDIAPKPGSVVYSPSHSRILLPKQTHAKKKWFKKQVQKQARSLLPKGYSYKPYSKGYLYEMKITSPTKAAAMSLRKRATRFQQQQQQQRSPVKQILPKDPNAPQPEQRSGPIPIPWTRRGVHNKDYAQKRREEKERQKQAENAQAAEDRSDKPPKNTGETKTREKPEERKGDKKECAPRSQKRGDDAGSQDESEDTGSEVEDTATLSQEESQNEEDDVDYMNDLMTACSTIGFNPYQKVGVEKEEKEQLSRQEVKKAHKLALISDDVVEADPLKNDRDMMFAQAFFNKMKKEMSKDLEAYMEVLDCLRQFEVSDISAVQVYEQLKGLLVNYPDLFEEVAAFLTPTQALEAGCFETNQLWNDLRAFLRKLEIHFCDFNKTEPRYQKVLRFIGRWKPGKQTLQEMRDYILPLLVSLPESLKDEFLRFFPDVPPSERDLHPDDFEEVIVSDSDEKDEGAGEGGEGSNRSGSSTSDDFEDVPWTSDDDRADPYRTKNCRCRCHEDPCAKPAVRDKNYHCPDCGMVVVNGQMFYQPTESNTSRRPVYIRYTGEKIRPPGPSSDPPQFPMRSKYQTRMKRAEAKKRAEAEQKDHDENEEEEWKKETENMEEKEGERDNEEEKDDDVEEDEDLDENYDGNKICQEDQEEMECGEEEEEEEEEEDGEDEGGECDDGDTAEDESIEEEVEEGGEEGAQAAASCTESPPLPPHSVMAVPKRMTLEDVMKSISTTTRSTSPMVVVPVSLAVGTNSAAPLVVTTNITSPLVTGGHHTPPLSTGTAQGVGMLSPAPLLSPSPSSQTLQQLFAACPSASTSTSTSVSLPQQQVPVSSTSSSPFQGLGLQAAGQSQMPRRTNSPVLNPRLQQQLLAMQNPNLARMRKRAMRNRPGTVISSSVLQSTPGGMVFPTPMTTAGQGASHHSPGAPIMGAQLLVRADHSGHVSVKGPDNKVIMFNTALTSSHALSDRLSQHQGQPSGSAFRSGAEGGVADDDKEDCEDSLPDVTSPRKNTQRSSFAGILKPRRQSFHAQSPLPVSTPVTSSPSGSPMPSDLFLVNIPMIATTAAQPLMPVTVQQVTPVTHQPVTLSSSSAGQAITSVASVSVGPAPPVTTASSTVVTQTAQTLTLSSSSASLTVSCVLSSAAPSGFRPSGSTTMPAASSQMTCASSSQAFTDPSPKKNPSKKTPNATSDPPKRGKRKSESNVSGFSQHKMAQLESSKKKQSQSAASTKQKSAKKERSSEKARSKRAASPPPMSEDTFHAIQEELFAAGSDSDMETSGSGSDNPASPEKSTSNVQQTSAEREQAAASGSMEELPSAPFSQGLPMQKVTCVAPQPTELSAAVPEQSDPESQQHSGSSSSSSHMVVDSGDDEEVEDGDPSNEESCGHAASGSSIMWQREEDQLILEMVRDRGNNQDTFAHIASRIQNITPQQVAERLAFLMDVLGSSSASSTDDDDDIEEVEDSDDDL